MTVQINGTTLSPQPREINWQSEIIDGKLNGTDAVGAYVPVTLSAPVDRGGSWNWASFENQVLTSITIPARYSTMSDSLTTYNDAIAKKIARTRAKVGDTVDNVELTVLVNI